MATWTDRLSGESFAAETLDDAIEYLRDALTPGETVAYELSSDSEESASGEITG